MFPCNVVRDRGGQHIDHASIANERVVFIVTLAADAVDWPDFVLATVLLAAAYMISRGIAKAGKVLEGR